MVFILNTSKNVNSARLVHFRIVTFSNLQIDESFVE